MRLFKAPKNKKELPWVIQKYYNGIIVLSNIYNAIVGAIFGARFYPSGNAALDAVRKRSLMRSDINDHLEVLFTKSVIGQPKLIVELGVGPGESTFVFEKVKELTGAKVVSVDLVDKSHAMDNKDNWFFIQKDDITFANEFPTWARSHGLEPLIDVLFIDTSHTYQHTVEEIKHWFPYLSKTAKVFFHDTNAAEIYWHRDHTVGISYDIDRGVIRPIEEYFETIFNEKKHFVALRNNWLITHYPYCSGFTVLERV